MINAVRVTVYLLIFPRLFVFCCRRDVLGELQPQGEVHAVHSVHRPDAHGDPLHRLQRRQVRLQLQLFLQQAVGAVRAVHRVPRGAGRVLSLRPRPRHRVRGVRGRDLLRPGELPGALLALHHLRRGDGDRGVQVHAHH